MWRKLLFLIAASTWFVACDDDNNNIEDGNNLTLDISGLKNLGADYRYEGWIMVNGSPVSTGTFTVNDDGDLSRNNFEVNMDDLDKATAFVITIEPAADVDPGPSDTKILAGSFSGNTASVSTSNSSAIGGNFSSAEGTYILFTPTTEVETDETSGIWFIDNTGLTPTTGLDLPDLPSGWEYEGWVVIDGQPVSTGKFSSTSGADDDASFSGTLDAPPFPGEDFVKNAPEGLTFPTDLEDADIVVTIEPNPDNSAAPFLLKPLKATVPANAEVMTQYSLTASESSFPTGTVERK